MKYWLETCRARVTASGRRVTAECRVWVIKSTYAITRRLHYRSLYQSRRVPYYFVTLDIEIDCALCMIRIRQTFAETRRLSWAHHEPEWILILHIWVPTWLEKWFTKNHFRIKLIYTITKSQKKFCRFHIKQETLIRHKGFRHSIISTNMISNYGNQHLRMGCHALSQYFQNYQSYLSLFWIIGPTKAATTICD